jgi:hypothetical protein
MVDGLMELNPHFAAFVRAHAFYGQVEKWNQPFFMYRCFVNNYCDKYCKESDLDWLAILSGLWAHRSHGKFAKQIIADFWQVLIDMKEGYIPCRVKTALSNIDCDKKHHENQECRLQPSKHGITTTVYVKPRELGNIRLNLEGVGKELLIRVDTRNDDFWVMVFTYTEM